MTDKPQRTGYPAFAGYDSDYRRQQQSSQKKERAITDGALSSYQ
ncbi:hypothetical protein [Bradyrhizobium sp. SZCCHNRI20481]|nr:hypothetical protein [Bradyrhizobium sp. SZCCHNRI20481]